MKSYRLLSNLFLFWSISLLLGCSFTTAQTAGVQKNFNIQYAKRENSATNLTSLDIYAPKSAKNAPVMVMIHGGGWSGGDKGNRGLIENKVPFFSENGFVFVSINYRLSPAVKHPAHIQDVAEAIAWVYDNIGKYGGEKDKIFVIGHSAGAHLAALAATDERRLKEHKKDLSIIKGVILLDGAGYDIPMQMKGLSFFPGILNTMYEDAFTTDEAVQKDASPYYQIKKGTKIAPFLIFTAGSRIASQNQSEKLAKALKDAGTKAEVINDAAKNHGSINRDFGLPNEMITKKAKEFLDSILKKG
jgi:acetyl esterase/lipase